MTLLGAFPAVVEADPVTDPRWRGLATGPGASLFTSPPWISAVCRSYGFTPEARIALDPAGEPVGGFAWVAVDDVRGRRHSSLPFSDRADPLTAHAPVFTALLDAAKTGDEQLTLRCMADSPALADPRLRTVGEAAWHGTPLDTGIDELHRRISGTSRRNIRQPSGPGCACTCATTSTRSAPSTACTSACASTSTGSSRSRWSSSRTSGTSSTTEAGAPPCSPSSTAR
ncbi:hypothetical protein BJF90_28310 [Pseudonocardia sp. CNS-004]|nr:hypothetical protein BJF90_28310 [Pseudonocardia sp. CNS-004]